MKFVIAKHDGIHCSGCTADIQRGDEMVLNFMDKPGYKKMLSYHVQCYVPWFTDMFNRKWSIWHNQAGTTKNPRIHRGRPVEKLEADKNTLLNRLRANRTYHEKLGHTESVKRLNKQIDRVKSTP